MDGVEGAVNLLHGLPEWAVDSTLVRDNAPVYQPIGERTFRRFGPDLPAG
ncbi:hypothetical protein ACGFMK_36605 [Amycolatopsis sp. NPDC049252]